jgi:hypothetical protein
MPEIGFGAEGNVGGSTTFKGASFIARRAISLTQLQWRVASTIGANYIIAIYQAPGGGSGVADLIATVTRTGETSGAVINTAATTPAVELEEGIYYVLWGSSSGVLSLTCYATIAITLLNVAGSVVAPGHPTGFTTALAVSSGAPATFDPTVGGDAVASSGTLAPTHRFA